MKIDLDKVLKDKSPNMSPLFAKLLGAYLKRIVHQEELNEFINRYPGIEGLDFARATLDWLDIKYVTHGLEEIDPEGRYFFVSNHPFGGLDGVMLAEIISKKITQARIIVNDILMNIPPLKSMCIPVNKHGKQNSEYLQLYKDAMNSKMPLITFPAGLCSRRTKGIVSDSVWKPTFVKNAIETQRDVVPIFFEGRLSNFFYGLHNLRTKLGIKANIEMLYLADEMIKQKGQTFNVYFGQPIPYRQLMNGESPKKWCEKVREIAYNLKK